ncbi:AAA family ATPase [Billgrantia montanilacus]|uniref:Endonuclease GajA/Old nuclease/RecF-like AAA domain-containing protein n=1 Tax=Billgrantia montanilacus TaxID=2282305 RepID=A0A368TTQ1_9GAMM|nr:AAA family ATPase [Halomonas montanilacus]RCV87998.1 hypothetical protein DU505_15240 [Halomonas montanilacus]
MGDNGVGKSSVLEALDSFFNDTEWTLNHNVLEKGFSEREPYICPVFLVEKRRVHKSSNLHKYLEVVSDIVWQIEAEDFISSHAAVAKLFCEHRDDLSKKHSSEDYFIVPIGIKKLSKTSQGFTLSVFESIEDFSARLNDEVGIDLDEYCQASFRFVKNGYNYIYLPSDIDFGQYTKIEGETVQALMGEKVEEVVRDFISDHQVREINQQLNSFMDSVSSRLENYEYKKPARKQNLFNQTHFASKVIEAYFSSKVLNLIAEGGVQTPIYDLSSGEKRRAIIDIAKAFLTGASEERRAQVILAVDEPEISLHTASCFPQFEKLRYIAENHVQVMLTTHWYGFMPIVSNGSATYISGGRNENYLLNLKRFRDDISKLRAKTKGSLPSNIELKGINDLVQSVISSVMGGEYKWIICEGVSDKIYLECFCGGGEKLVILPVSGAPMVKKFYTYIYLALLDERSDVKGRIYFLLDTDEEHEFYEARDKIPSIRIRRLLNDSEEGCTKLVSITNSKVSPPTEIEDSLDAEVFLLSMREVAREIGTPDFLDLIDGMSINDDSLPSGLAFDWRDSERKAVANFLKMPSVKVRLAEAYSRLHRDEKTPQWFREVKDFLLL